MIDLVTHSSAAIDEVGVPTPVTDRIGTALNKASGELRAAVTHLFAGGGKLLRPALVILCARAVGSGSAPSTPQIQEMTGSVYDVAAAVELIHVASLIHDDIIDRASTRRNRPSVNTLWNNHMAVLAGDFLFAEAFNLLSPHATKGAIGLMTQAISAMCQGEIDQRQQAFDANIKESTYLDRVEKKTAKLLAASCEAGARVIGADEFLCRALADYGRYLGLAYQITDDVLDLQGNGATLGKPVGSDLREGVITLPVIRLLEHGDYRPMIASALAARNVDEAMIEQVRTAAISTGTIASVKRKAQELGEKARQSLEVLPASPARARLEQLITEAIFRDR